MGWTRERLVVVSSRDEARAIRVGLHWLDAQGNQVDALEVESFPWATTQTHRPPTVIAAPGRAAFTLGFAVTPDPGIQQVVYQRCSTL
jgi:hypothetical protein